MSDVFKDRSANIIVIESASPVRQLVTDQLKKLGFSNINGVGALKDAMGILEVEPVHWVLCSPNIENSDNNVQLLSLFSSRPVLKDTRITMFMEESDLEILPLLYEKGLMSHIMKPMNKNIIEEQLPKILETLESYDWNEVKTSASYLRTYLQEQKNYKALVQLERGLLKLYPAECTSMLEMSEPLFHSGDPDQAKNILKQVLIIDPAYSDEVEAKAKSLFGEDFNLKEETADAGGVNILGIQRCVIIDADESCRSEYKRIFSDFGVEECFDFSSGEDAWTWLNANEAPDLIVQEWKLPEVNGPLLIQRIRGKFPAVPIILVSSLVTSQDQPLILEMGIESILEKPLREEAFKKSLVFVKQQERLPANAGILERKIMQFLKLGKLQDAIAVKEQFLAEANIPEFYKKRITALFSYHNGDYVGARNLAIEAIKSDPESLFLLNFIGKCLMKLKDFQAAVLCFKKAQAISPQNVERLCEIATSSYEIGQKEDSEKALEESKKIDADNPIVAETEAPIKIQEGKLDEARDILAKMESVQDLVGYMNNKAVALTKSGLIGDGIGLYKKTVEALPDNKKETRGQVAYNLALALAKQGDLEDAVKALDGILSSGAKKVARKSGSLKLRIERSMANGSELTFITDSPLEDQEAATAKGKQEGEASTLVIGYIQSSPGEICCYKVFINPDPLDEKWHYLNHEIPRFTPRAAIEREEAAGLERMMSAS